VNTCSETRMMFLLTHPIYWLTH